MPKTLNDLVEGAVDGRQRGELLDQAVAAVDGVPALHGLAIAIDGPGGEIALAIGEGLEELGREAVREIVQHIFARGDVDLNVAPFFGRNLRQPSLHQRLAGRDDLNDGGMALAEVALDGRDQRRSLHGSDEVIEESLLGALESRAGGGLSLRVERAGRAGDVCGLHRGLEIIMDDGERPGIGVVYVDLFVRQLVFEQFVFDAFVGKRAGGIEPEGFHVAGEHLHGRDAARLDRFDELASRREGEVLAAPEAEPLGVGEVVDRRGPCRGNIDDASVWQRVLKPQPRAGPAARAPARRALLCRQLHSAWRGSRRR